MQPLVRREFLKHSAAGVILGLPFVEELADAADVRDIPVLAQARQRMQREIKPGILIVVPEQNAAANRLAGELANVLNSDKAEIKQLLCQAVFVCLRADWVQRTYVGLAPKSAVVLLNNDGKPVAELKRDAKLFTDDFAAKMTELLHGIKGERLAEWTQLERKALGKTRTASFESSMRSLESKQTYTRQSAARRLAQLAPYTTALLASELRKDHPSEVRDVLAMIFDYLYNSASPSTPGVRMPYGVQWGGPQVIAPVVPVPQMPIVPLRPLVPGRRPQMIRPGIARPVFPLPPGVAPPVAPGPCLACGLSFPAPAARRFLQFQRR